MQENLLTTRLQKLKLKPKQTEDNVIDFTCPVCHGKAHAMICQDGKIIYDCENKGELGNFCNEETIKRELNERWNQVTGTVIEWGDTNGNTEKKKKKKTSRIKKASDFKEIDHEYLWDPYLPIGNFTVLMAAGGTGKSVLTCGIAAAVSTGTKLYGMEKKPKPQNVLFISAEDSGEDYRSRLKASGADLDRICIVDKDDSLDLEYLDGEFEDLIAESHAALVIVDPWHAFAGDIDINRINVVRPLYQKLDRMAAKYHCAMILVSHVNKKAQEGNANNAAVGSVDFINASRSALQVIFDTEDEDSRIMVHTKINHRRFGQSLKYRIIKDGGIEWTGTSPITRFTLEEAAGKRKKPLEIITEEENRLHQKTVLLDAVLGYVEESGKTEINIAYQQFLDDYGDDIFGGRTRPGRCFEDIQLDLFNHHIRFEKCSVSYNGKGYKGIKFLKTNTAKEAFDETFGAESCAEPLELVAVN